MNFFFIAFLLLISLFLSLFKTDVKEIIFLAASCKTPPLMSLINGELADPVNISCLNSSTVPALWEQLTVEVILYKVIASESSIICTNIDSLNLS